MGSTFSDSRRRRWLPAFGLAFSLSASLASVPAVEACSILTLRDADTVLMGNNEDWLEPGLIWFVPGKKNRYGRVNVGFQDDFAQGSMNEKGLSFDAAALQEVPWEPDPDKETPRNLIEKIMNECATVEEALAYFEKYNSRFMAQAQFLFADATGDSAVVAWEPATGLSIQRIEGRQQVITNTRVEKTSYRCQRHTRASRTLDQHPQVSVRAVASALEAVHQRGPVFTSYSTIYDLKAKKVHVYNLANFDEVVTFDLATELAKGPETHALADLFDHSPDLETIKASPQRQDFGTRVSLTATQLDRFVGSYAPAESPEVRVRIVRQGEGLRVETPDQSATELFPESETSFRLVPDRGRVVFDLAPDGTVRGMTLQKQIDLYAERVPNAAHSAESADEGGASETGFRP